MVTLHNDRFNDDAAKVAPIKYILSGTALKWYIDLPLGGMPATLNNLQHDFFAKFRVAKTRHEWTKELDKYKYVPGTNSLTMINKFHVDWAKLQWPLPVQIVKFVRILPMNLRQFFVSRAHFTFADVEQIQSRLTKN